MKTKQTLFIAAFLMLSLSQICIACGNSNGNETSIDEPLNQDGDGNELLLSDILYFSKIIDNLEYLPEHLYNDNIFPESILYKFPKLVYDTLGEDDDISLFNESFANSNEIMLLYQNIIFPIRAYLPKYNMDEDDEKLEIFLIALKKPDSLSGMFEECSDLEEISINIKDKEIIPENNQNDLTNTISKFTIYNTEDNEKNSNAYKLAREMERNEDNGYNENLTSSIPIQPEPTKYYTVKYLLTNYFRPMVNEDTSKFVVVATDAGSSK